MKLTPKKQAFVDACRAAGISSPAKRSDLVAVANNMGQKYAPAWIVQNDDLRHDRGWFIVPGLDDTGVVIDSPETAAAVDAAAARMGEALVPKGNDAPVAELSAIRGMTAGATSLVPDRLKTYVSWSHHDTVETVIKSGLFAPMYVTGLSGNARPLWSCKHVRISSGNASA